MKQVNSVLRTKAETNPSSDELTQPDPVDASKAIERNVKKEDERTNNKDDKGSC
jgi:hypothetical protein